MSNLSSVPEFGERKPGQQYAPRPGAYAILTDGQGRIAVLETPRGCYLPGGGSEGVETPEETLVREVREECGFEISVGVRVGEAVEYVHTTGNVEGIRKECIFFQAMVASAVGGVIEADHVLVWLEPTEARRRLGHESQRWAVAKAIDESRKKKTAA